MYRCQLNFALFCAALDISWQHLNHPNLLLLSVCKFHVHFNVRLILRELGIYLPHEDGKMIKFKAPVTVSVMTMSRSDRDMDA